MLIPITYTLRSLFVRKAATLLSIRDLRVAFRMGSEGLGGRR